MKNIAIASGVFYGVCLLLFGLVLAGAGHGWGGAIVPGLCAVATTPYLALAFLKPQLARFRSLAKTLAVLLLVDIFLCVSVDNEVVYFTRVLGGAMLWIILFSLPQMAAWTVFLRDKQQLAVSFHELGRWCRASLRRVLAYLLGN